MSRPRGGAPVLRLLLPLLACGRDLPPPTPGALTVSVEQQSAWVRNFNPLSSAASARWPTSAGIYEPLMIFNDIAGRWEPWLGTEVAWDDTHLRARVTLREGVRWSDGRDFSARDVAFTFQLLRKFPALDRSAVWDFLEDVKAPDDRTVEFVFGRVFLPGLDDLLPQPIVPQHVWSEVADPVTFANPNPVATGPFTEVRTFRNQLFELGSNPHYWQPGKPFVKVLRFPAYPSNDRANLALAFDEVDWAANFVPAIDRVFVQRDPAHHRYWFPLTGTMVFLYANTTRAPFDDRRVRQALSLAIDRELLNQVAVYGYSRPSGPSGLSDAFAAWRPPGQSDAQSWVSHDPGRAAALLDEAGYRLGADGLRHRPDGKPLELELLAVAGWSDWVRASQVIARDLRKLGLAVDVRTYDFSAWFERLQQGNFALSLGWSVEGPTPYVFYRWLMSPKTVKPIGVAASGNWHRYGSPAADALLSAFEREPDPARQHALVGSLTDVFAAEAPAIPLYPNPSWGAYNTLRFTGFPSAADPYGDPSPNKIEAGDCLRALVSIRPVGP